jgi:putative transposase
MRYRRATTKGGTYFFTLNLLNRQSTLLVDEFDHLRSVINKVKQQHPFKLDAMVVMPDHIHAMWTLPEDDHDFATRWMLIKSGFSRALPKQEPISTSRQKKGERGIWQRRYWEHLIRDDKDFQQHVDYIHFNPVKHGYVSNATEWRYSTIHRYIELSLVSPDWGGSDIAGDGFGER